MSITESLNTEETTIYRCLDINTPKSFFLFAGAGSGKTRSLVQVLKKFKSEHIHELRQSGRKIAIITYTNAACEEIQRRLDFDTSFVVSTIHSFAWELINPYVMDIRNYLQVKLRTEIDELNDKQNRARSTTTKTYVENEQKLRTKTKRLDNLDSIQKFTYNPTGENTGRDSLNHTEVIAIASNFIKNKELMQKILIRKFPVLLIDESQDTNKGLIESLFILERNNVGQFGIGMFGDTMQRIYFDGKTDLGKDLPDDWETPAKTINFRCPKRVVALINLIRKDFDGKEQVANKTDEGVVRLFIVDAQNEIDKSSVENDVITKMHSFTGDDNWNDTDSSVKILTLEHEMAASRGGFIDFFAPLYSIGKFKTGLLDGKLSGITFLLKQVLPLVATIKSNDSFKMTEVLKKYSPYLSSENLQANAENAFAEVKKAKESVEKIRELFEGGADPTIKELLEVIAFTHLYDTPEQLQPFIVKSEFTEEDPDITDKKSIAWKKAISTSWEQFEGYANYVSDQSCFGTHQGIKGLEFPRVMVILDDEGSKGFQFSYEKLFGAKELSDTDLKNEAEGKDTTVKRTKRLFYVTCSRTEESLAVVAYTENPEAVKCTALESGWFNEDEIVIVD